MLPFPATAVPMIGAEAGALTPPWLTVAVMLVLGAETPEILTPLAVPL